MKSCSLLLLLAVAVAVFPGPCVAKPHRHRHSHAKTQHKSRLSGTVTHRHKARELDASTDAAYTLQFALLADNNSPDCIESSVSVELSYRVPNGRWETLCSFTRAPGDCSVDREVVPLPQDIDQGMVQFRWLQQEQALGTCNCWQIDEVVITDAEEDRVLSFSAFQGSSGSLDDGFVCYHYGASAGQLGCLDNEGLVFCNGSASVPRGVVTPMYDLSTGDEVSVSCTASDLFEPVGDVEFCATDGTEETFIDIRFQLSFHDNVDLGDTRVCDALESFDEGVELAIRRSEDEQWVPLKFYTLSRFTEGRDEQIDIGNYDQESSILSLRGYNVSVVAGDTSVMSVTECISDERFFQEGTQFRWLQTVIRDRRTVRDTWYIDNVEIAVHRRQNSRTEFFDDFSDRSSINTTLWPQVRNGELGGADAGTGVGTVSDCVPESEIVLFFGAIDITNTSVIRRAMSRMAVTKPLNLVPDIDECSEGLHFCNVNANCVDTVGSFTCTCREGFEGNGVICTSQEASVAAGALTDLFNSTAEAPPLEIISSLRDVLGNLSEGTTFPPNISRLVLDSVSDLIDMVQESDGDGDGSTDIGSSLLDVMDSFALGPYDPELGELEDNDNIALVHMTLNTSDGDPSDQVEGIVRNGSSIVLPGEVFMNCNASEVTVASYFYRNLSGLLPDSLPSDPQDSGTTMRLASPILSSALQCGSMQFNTRNLNLTNPVVTSFNQGLKQRKRNTTSLICVFWEFDDSSANGGQWSTEGCTRNDTASNESQTVCECYHLTHFALLLSTTRIPLTSAEALSLRIIGIICVTISLICLTITILTFLFLRSLWSMRSYIHINLCVSLFVAQLTFIVAAEPRGSVAGCQAVAVLLHYFFLVTFMWMLMEGVVLYVILVRVFIDITVRNRYLIGFTLASYGIPLLYLCITVPLGFALDNGPHYAGDDPQSCWLRYDTHFIWAFIAPVIVIILANIGFFIMAITIMYRHQRRQTHKSKLETIKHWLKASISLVIVMGITWIIGILVFNRDLLFVAYIYTIFIGLQGLIIFILFVVLSKQVREAYTKWWTVKVASSDFLSKYFGEKSYAIHTASTAVVGSTNKNSLPNDNGKSRGTHNLSPSHDFTDSGRGDLLEKKDNTDFSVTWSASVGLVPVSSGDNTEGGVAVEEEMEALADVLSLEGQRERQSEIENGDVRTSELHVDRK